MRDVSPALYPFARNWLQLGALRLHYLDEGPRQGVPVVMVHGNPTWSFYYRELVRELRTDRRCVVPDHIGCGFSDKPSDEAYEYTLSRRVDDLGALVDSLGLAQVDLVVHDWGGMIGMAWAARDPARVRRIVALNTAAFRNPKGVRLPPALWLVRNTPVGAGLVRGLNAFSRGATLTCTTRRRMPREIADAYTAPYDSWKDRIATLRFVEDIPLGPGDRAWDTVVATEQALSAFSQHPLMVCWGMKDFVFDAAFLAEWERRFPDAEFHRFDDCGHYVLEDAADEIVPLVRRFLDATDRG